MGASRSGKSLVAGMIASRFDRAYAYDPKGTDPLPNSSICTTDAAVLRAIRSGASRITYTPTRDELARIGPTARDAGIIDGHFGAIIATGAAWCVLIHELGDIADESRIGPGFSELIRKGKVVGHVLIAVIQRTVEIPRIIPENADHVFLFALYDPRALAAPAAMMGEPVRTYPLPVPFTYDFGHRGPDGSLGWYPAIRLPRPTPTV